MQVTLFDASGLDRTIELSEISLESLQDHQVIWIDIKTPEPDSLQKVAQWIAVPSLGLPLKDAGRLRPRVDNMGSWLKVRIHTISPDYTTAPLHFLVGQNWIITVHDAGIDVLDRFQNQIQEDSQLGGLSGAKFLAAMLDWHLTGFFRAIEVIEAEVDAWDSRAIKTAQERDVLVELRGIRKKIASLRRALIPHREVYGALQRPDIATVFGETQSDSVFPSLWSQMERAVDSIDNARELVLGSFEMYSAQMAQRTNDVMRTLTVVTVLLLPVSTIASILGMNFETHFFHSKDAGFWTTLTIMCSLVSLGAFTAYRRGWIRI